MRKSGMDKIKEAKGNGEWDTAYAIKDDIEIPQSLENALDRNSNARENFDNFAPSYRRDYIRWVTHAKRQETIDRRIKEVVKRAKKNIKPGMM